MKIVLTIKIIIGIIRNKIINLIGRKQIMSGNKSKFTIKPKESSNQSEEKVVDVIEAKKEVVKDNVKLSTAVSLIKNTESGMYSVIVIDYNIEENVLKVVETIDAGHSKITANERLKIEVLRKLINKEL